MKIQVKIKHVYGNKTVYPVCAKALIFVKMLNQKSFTHKDLCAIESLGYTIEAVPEQVF